MTPLKNIAAAPVLRRVDVNGISLAAFEWRADLRGHGPTLFLVHANGFHGRVWDQVIRHLAPLHVIAFEQRGHGRSENAPFKGWDELSRDLAGAVVELDVSNAVGVGHSMGAHSLVHAASIEQARFTKLVLIDPTMFAPLAYLTQPPPPEAPHPAGRRKNRFESAQAMFDRLVDRLPYSTLDPQALRDYCEHGLRPAADGQGFELACDPATEGHIYNTYCQDAGIYASIRALQIPVTVMRARPLDMSNARNDTLGSMTWPGLAGEFVRGRDVHLSEKTHLMPMEDPPLIARLLHDVLTTPV